MLTMLMTWLFSAIGLYLTAIIVPNFRIKSFGYSMLTVIIVGLLNMFIRPILIFLSFPINILTLGLFTFVVNAAILKLAAKMLSGFEIKGWLPAILGAIVLAIIQGVIYFIFLRG